MENILGTSLVIVSVGIVVLLLVLSLLAGIVYLLTLTVKDKPEDVAEIEITAPVVEPALDARNAQKIRAALIGVALARAEAETAPVMATEAVEETNSWRQFHRSRRLNQPLHLRRV